MKRDLDLIRQILLDLERGKTERKHHLPGRMEAEISYHVQLMHREGLIDAHKVRTHDTPPSREAWKATALTSKGHEFLELARDESLWRAVLAKVGSSADSVALSVLAENLREFGNKNLGIGR